MRDVIVIGCGGGGPVVAKELAARGLDVLVLEGDARFANPEEEWSRLENDANNPITGYLRVGPSDRSRPAWLRSIPQDGFLWQIAGVGGTTLHDYGNNPRAAAGVFARYDGADKDEYDTDHLFPLTLDELRPYYEWVEATLPVQTAAMGTKEALFAATYSDSGIHGGAKNASPATKQGADTIGRLVGLELLKALGDVNRILNCLIIADDDVEPLNRVRPGYSAPQDTNGIVPEINVLHRRRSKRTFRNREYLAGEAVRMLRSLGARSRTPDGLAAAHPPRALDHADGARPGELGVRRVGEGTRGRRSLHRRQLEPRERPRRSERHTHHPSDRNAHRRTDRDRALRRRPVGEDRGAGQLDRRPRDRGRDRPRALSTSTDTPADHLTHRRGTPFLLGGEGCGPRPATFHLRECPRWRDATQRLVRRTYRP